MTYGALNALSQKNKLDLSRRADIRCHSCSSKGAELRRPLGIAIVGGLVVSQVLTLYTTPVVYLCLEKIRVSVNRRRGHTVADEVVPDGRLTDAGLPAGTGEPTRATRQSTVGDRSGSGARNAGEPGTIQAYSAKRRTRQVFAKLRAALMKSFEQRCWKAAAAHLSHDGSSFSHSD
jgi:hypothetical protein